jgi:SAM-dependent methyltransferase
VSLTLDYRIDWHNAGDPPAQRWALPCPVCGFGGEKAPVLTTPSVADPTRRQLVTFLRCRVCSSLFTADRTAFDYELAQSTWASEYYLEQGAGIDSMIAPILHLPAEPRRSLLEIGCSFGFALHFAQHQRGWIAEGIDPSPIAAEGRRVLGVDIRSAYLTERSLPDAEYDVILASEVIEHLPLGRPFLEMLRARLRPWGVLALTTPDAASITPSADLGVLMPVLSPGHHLTLYSATGLEHELRAAGFTAVRIEARGSGLVAWASQQPLQLRPPSAADRADHEAWLTGVAKDQTLPQSLHDGIVYRLLKTHVNAGAEAAARHLFETVVASCRDRFGLDLSNPPLLSAELSGELLGGSPRGIPYNLPGLLYYRGMIEMIGSQPGDGALWFDAAGRVARGCCAFYHAHGADDGETADLVGSSARLALLAYCHRDPVTVVSRMRGRTEVGAETVSEIFLRLLDLGHLEAAAAVAEQARSAVLSALAEGYTALIRRNDPKGAAIAFRTAERLAESPSPSLSERVLFGLVISTAHEDPAAAVARARSAPIASERIYRSLFVRLVDLGHLEEAIALEPLGANLDDDWEVLNARALIALNHRRDGAAAAALFLAAFTRAQTAGIEGNMLWQVKYHEAFAWKSIGRLEPARTAARVLLSPPTNLPPVPLAFQEKARALGLFD